MTNETPISGAASQDATRAYFNSYPTTSPQALGLTNLWVSQAGFGSYRVDQSKPDYFNALTYALKHGVNLIDTSANYGAGEAEVMIGQCLRSLVSENELQREAVVLVSKCGYLQGDTYQQYQSQEKPEDRFLEVIPLGEGVAHCIHPHFIADQLTGSLDRLGVSCIDVYLLHNPEYFLTTYATPENIEAIRDDYYTRIKRAFIHLEEEVKLGRISYYGVSSNTFPDPAHSPFHTSLERLLAIAESVSDDHHFRVIQSPLNVYESSLVLDANQSGLQTTLGVAHKNNIGVLANRPLNAIVNKNQLIRLANVTVDDDISSIEIEDELNGLMVLEDSWDDLDLKSSLSESEEKAIRKVFSIGQELNLAWRDFSSLEQWRETVSYHIYPRVDWAMGFLGEKDLLIQDEKKQWFETYIARLNQSIKSIVLYYQLISASRANDIRYALNDVDSLLDGLSLSQQALRIQQATQGISSTLVGMRQIGYVQDIAVVLNDSPPKEDRLLLWKTVREKLGHLELIR